MKVHSHALEAYSRTTVGPVGTARPAAPSADVATDEAAHVTVSAEARALAAKSSGIDDKKVESLRGQIESGEYKVNPQMLAMRLLDALG
jgi:flagellar biosynthesis anti-sigma factor FlgM